MDEATIRTWRQHNKNSTMWVGKYYQIGLNCIPLNGKRPIVKWDRFQREVFPKTEWLNNLMGKGYNIGIVCGDTSGGLVVLDFDDMAIYDKIIAAIPELKEYPTATSGSGKGKHIYIRIDAPKIFNKVNMEGLDILGNGAYVVAPPSRYPKGRKNPDGAELYYTWDNWNWEIPVISVEKWRKIYAAIMEIIGKDPKPELMFKDKEKPSKVAHTPANISPKKRELVKGDMLKIITAVSEIYKEGQRDLIVEYLAGWLYKNGVPLETAEAIITMLAENNGDEELKQRLTVVRRTYKLDPDRVKGWTGLIEIINNNNAGHIADTLTEIIPAKRTYTVMYAPAYGSRVIVDYDDMKIYIGKADEKKGFLRYERLVFDGYPAKLTVINDNITNDTEIKVIWRSAGRDDMEIQGTIDGIRGQLATAGFVMAKNLAPDTLNILISAMIKDGMADFQNITTRSGFYVHNGNIEHIAPDEWREYSEEEIKAGLEKLHILITKVYNHIPDKAATVLKWALFSPFGYIYKTEFRKRFKWLYLYGASFTGKSTLAHIGLGLWGVNDADHEKSFSSIDTPARIGHILASGTYPIVVDETGDMWEKPSIVDIIKNSIDSPIARGRYIDGVYKNMPALASLIFTSNERPPNNPAIHNRFIQIPFFYDDRIPDYRADLFNITDYFIPSVGYAIADMLIDMYNNGEWDGRTWKDIITLALDRLYRAYIGTVPEWIYIWYEEKVNSEDNTAEKLRIWFINYINNLYTRHIRTPPEEITPDEILWFKLKELANGGYIPFLHYTNRGTLYINVGAMLEVINSDIRTNLISNEENLKQLLQGQIQNAKYQPRKIGGKSQRVLICDIDDIIKYLLPPIEEIPDRSETDLTEFTETDTTAQ